MNQKLKAKLLYKFLKRNCILNLFFENLEKQHKNKIVFTRGKINMLKTLIQCRDIDRAFLWDNTKEGFKFWSDLYGRECRYEESDNWFINFFKKP